MLQSTGYLYIGIGFLFVSLLFYCLIQFNVKVSKWTYLWALKKGSYPTNKSHFEPLADGFANRWFDGSSLRKGMWFAVIGGIIFLILFVIEYFDLYSLLGFH